MFEIYLATIKDKTTCHILPERRGWVNRIIIIIIIIRRRRRRRTCLIVDFAAPSDHWVKLKEREQRDKYLNLARELKKLWNMNVTVMLIVIGTLATVTKGVVQALRNIKTERGHFKIQHYWDRLEYWEESWRFEETCCHSNDSERPSVNAGVKNSQKSKKW